MRHLLLLVLCLFLFACNQDGSSHAAATDVAKNVPPQPIVPSQPIARPTPSNWMYETLAGNSFNKTRYTATTLSKTTLNFSFPYEGAQKPQLVLRSDGVVLVLFRGQAVCGIEECPMLAKFDDGTIDSVHVSTPDNGSTGVIYFSNDAPAFIRKLIVSKKLALDISFYQEGDREVDYDLRGLDLHKIDGWFELDKSDIPNALCLQSVRKTGHDGFLLKEDLLNDTYTFNYKFKTGEGGTCTYSLKDKVPNLKVGPIS